MQVHLVRRLLVCLICKVSATKFGLSSSSRRGTLGIAFFFFFFFFYIERVLAKGKQICKKKIPLVARPCKKRQ